MYDLILNSYLINDVILKTALKPNESVTLESKCRYSLSKREDHEDEIHSELKVEITSKSSKRKFRLEATITGEFIAEKELWENEEELQQSTMNLLYPYLRTFVLNLTTNSGLPPLILPIKPLDIQKDMKEEIIEDVVDEEEVTQ